MSGLGQGHEPMGPMIAMMRVLANGTRLNILRFLLGGERSVAQIEAALAIGQPTLSQQLAELREVNILVARREGKYVHYSLAGTRMHRLVLSLLDAARPEAEIDDAG